MITKTQINFTVLLGRMAMLFWDCKIHTEKFIKTYYQAAQSLSYRLPCHFHKDGRLREIQD
jgi:hypothetical protein